MKSTLIIGASPRSTSYANMAMLQLEQVGHEVLLYNPNGRVIDEREVLTDLNELKGGVHTVTLYVRPSRLEPLAQALIDLKVKRILFNPGTEDEDLMDKFRQAEIEVLEACTLVLLRTGQY